MSRNTTTAACKLCGITVDGHSKGKVSYFVHMYVDNSVNTTLEHLHTGWGSGRLQLLPRFHPLPQLLGELLQASLAVRPLISFDVVGPTSVGRGRGGGGGGEGRGGEGEGREER